MRTTRRTTRRNWTDSTSSLDRKNAVQKLSCQTVIREYTRRQLVHALALRSAASPVIALNSRSNPLTVVRTAYDLKPSSTISSRCIPAVVRPRTRACRLERLLQYCAAGVALRYDTDTTALSAERNRTLFDERIESSGLHAQPILFALVRPQTEPASDGRGRLVSERVA